MFGLRKMFVMVEICGSVGIDIAERKINVNFFMVIEPVVGSKVSSCCIGTSKLWIVLETKL